MDNSRAGKYLTVFLTVVIAFLFVAQNSRAEDAWLPDFDDICGKTQDAGSMTREELTAFVAKCDKVRAAIENSDNPQKKVYLFRLEKCRKLFAFMLESSEKK